jgi:hypothetical protein
MTTRCYKIASQRDLAGLKPGVLRTGRIFTRVMRLFENPRIAHCGYIAAVQWLNL